MQGNLFNIEIADNTVWQLEIKINYQPKILTQAKHKITGTLFKFKTNKDFIRRMRKHDMRLYLWVPGTQHLHLMKDWHPGSVSHVASRFYKLVTLLELLHMNSWRPSVVFHVNCTKKMFSRLKHIIIISTPQPCWIHLYKMLEIPITCQVLMFKSRQDQVFIHTFLLEATEKHNSLVKLQRVAKQFQTNGEQIGL